MTLHLLISLVVGIQFLFASSSFIENSQYLRCTSAVKNTNLKATPPCKLEQNPTDDDDMITWIVPQSSSSPPKYFKQTKRQVRSEIISYLHTNLMPVDLLNEQSLGFPPSTNSTNDNSTLPDGLSFGILEPTVNISLYAKQNYPWTQNIPKDLYYEYVASFANVNEARTNWRPIFHDLVRPIIQDIMGKKTEGGRITPTVKEVVQALNEQIWKNAAAYSNSESIEFQSGQTPLIYDPMSILIFGHASCTGLSVFLVNILRTVGIPARLAGTAAWHDQEEDGNHSWVEFWSCEGDCDGDSGGRWTIMESKPASGSDGKVDLSDPCQWWFCNEKWVKGTLFWAARLDRYESDGVVFPMAWDTGNNGVVGEDRTSYMRALCSGC